MENGWLAASNLFDMFTQSIKFYFTLYSRIKSIDVWKCDSSNRQEKWMGASSSKFTAKFGLVFVLTLENAFS